MVFKKITFTLFILITTLTPLLAFAEPVGKVSLMEGSVDILSKGKTAAEIAKIDMPVNIGDIVRTKSNSKAEIKFIDDSLLRIAEKSRIEIKEYLYDKTLGKRKGTMNLMRGKIRSIVSKVVSRQQDYNILTKTAVAGVRATDFFVISQALSTQVVVKEGIVAVKNISPKIVGEVMVKMNQMTNVVQNTPPMPPITVKAEDIKSLTEATEPPKEEKKKKEDKEKTHEKTESSKQPTKKEPDSKKLETAEGKTPSDSSQQGQTGKETTPSGTAGITAGTTGALPLPGTMGILPVPGTIGVLPLPGTMGISPAPGTIGTTVITPTIPITEINPTLLKPKIKVRVEF